MDFEDPLAKHIVTEHPLSSSSSQFSSAPGSPQQWSDLQSDVQRVLRNYKPLRRKDDTVNVFEAFIKYLCKDGQVILMQEILQFRDRPSELRQLRDFLVDSILKPLLMAGGKQPKSLTPTPVIGAHLAIQFIMTEIEPSSRNEQSTLKRRCLARDNHRCIATGMIDAVYHSKLPQQSRLNPPIDTVKTECAHILPFGLRTFNPNSAQEVEVKAQIWWAIYRYFPFVANKIHTDSVNNPANAITLWREAHGEFGEFHITFEPMDEVNRYRVHNFSSASLLRRYLPKSITLTQSDSAVVMPDPNFLRLHYQVAMILQHRPRGEDWRAPSWSWASIDSPSGLGFIAPATRFSKSFEGKIEAAECIVAGQDDFGQVTSGFIRLKASLGRTFWRIRCRGCTTPAGRKGKAGFPRADYTLYTNETFPLPAEGWVPCEFTEPRLDVMGASLGFFSDALIDDAARYGFFSCIGKGSCKLAPCHLLYVHRFEGRGGGVRKAKTGERGIDADAFLVLTEVKGQSDTFERIGLLTITHNAQTKREEWFKSVWPAILAPERTVTLI